MPPSASRARTVSTPCSPWSAAPRWRRRCSRFSGRCAGPRPRYWSRSPVRGAAVALRQFRERRLAVRAERPIPGPARAYLGLLGITLLNPTTVIYFAALVVGTRAGTAVRPLEQGVFVLAAFAASASWQLLLAGSGALLGRGLTGHRGRLVTALLSSCVMLGLAARMALSPG